MAKHFIVVGGGGFGREVACWAADRFGRTGEGHVVGFLDDDVKDAAGFPQGISYRGNIDGYAPREGEELLLAIGSPKAKQQIVARLKSRGARFASLVHPCAVVAMTAAIGEGVVLCPFAAVSANAVVGDFVAVNIASSVGHDVRVGAYSTLSAHDDLTGGVVLEERVMVGSGARVLPGVRIGADAVIGAGAVVVRNVAAGITVYTPPAKQL